MPPDWRGVRTLAPAKINATLLVGPVRPHDGRHELASVMQSLTLADDVALVPAPPGQGGDAVACPGVTGPNLALDALVAFRAATGWDAPPLTVRIEKRIPVAAGMAGGSADASATLRLAAHAAGVDDPALLQRLATALGADVPHGLEPGLALAAGAGEALERIDGVLPGGLVVVPAPVGLSTPAVFRRADELRPPRAADEIAAALGRLRAALGDPAGPRIPDDLAANDLADAAVDLAPVVGDHLTLLRAAGAAPATVCGSGPTVAGWFADEAAAAAVADDLGAHGVRAVVALPTRGAPVATIPAVPA
nr:hypothetical protein [Patulibacter sp. SYSU D01012]